MLPSWARVTAVMLEPVLVNDHGVQAPDWGQAPTETPVPGCSWQPSTGTDDDQNREGSLGTGLLFMPPATPVTSRHRIRVGAHTYRVIGEPADWQSPTGALDHIQVRLERWEG